MTPGLINRDFSDIKATMSGMGYAMMGTATAKGENAAVEAAREAINSPLLEDSRIPRLSRHPDQHHRLEPARAARSQ